jgi:hypothetical protein
MSTLKTTLSVQSASLFPASINFSSIANTTISGDTSYGKVNLTRGTNTLLNSSAIGGKGTYVYVSSPTSNSKSGAINIFGENSLVDGEPIATLYAGEFAIVPVSKRQGRIYATSTNGAQTLDYLIGNLGETVGQSALFKYSTTDGDWHYEVSDSAAAEANATYNTGITTISYGNFNIDSIVQDKGYLLELHDSGGAYVAYPIDSNGKPVSHTMPNDVMDSPRHNLNGKGHAFFYGDVDPTVSHFDGDTVNTYIFPNATTSYIENNYDQATADGSFIAYVEDYEGVSNQEAVFVINGARKHMLSSINYVTSNSDYADTFVYNFANFIVHVVSNDDTSTFIKTLNIFSAAGVLLKSVDVPSTYTDYGINFHGIGKCLISMYSDSDPNLPWLFFHYDQATNRLTGEDLTWTHARGTNYDSIEVLSSRLFQYGDSNYASNALAAIVYSSTDYSGHIAHENVNYADLIYMFEGESTPSSYVIWNTPGTNFWINLDASNASQNGCVVTGSEIYIPWALSTTTGALNLLRVVKGSAPTTVVAVADQTLVTNPGNSNAWRFEGFDEGFYSKVMLAYTSTEGKTVYKIFGSSGTVALDTLTIDSPGEWNYRIRGKSLFIRTWSLSPNRNWYLNASTNAFVEIPVFYSQRHYMNGTTENGQNNGFMLLVKPEYWAPYNSWTARILNNGVLGPERTLHSSGTYSAAGVRVSTQGVAFGYKQSQSSDWVVKFFSSTDLSLTYSVDTECSNWTEDSDSAGNRNYWSFYTGTEYRLFSFAKNSCAVKDVMNPANRDYALNDYWWWD